MKKGDMEKYFKQKNWSVLEFICIIIAVISLIAATFIQGCGPVGLSVAFVFIIALILIKSNKIKDSDVDSTISYLTSQNGINMDQTSINQTFDLRSQYVVYGKDGKLRANEYLISDFDFRESDLLIKVYKLDLITNTVNKFEFVVAKNETIVLEEDYVNTPVGNKTQYYLASRVFTDRIPVSVYDVDSSNLIEKICRYVKN